MFNFSHKKSIVQFNEKEKSRFRFRKKMNMKSKRKYAPQ